MNTLKLIGSFAVGALAGAATAYLTAPQSGKKTRQQISDEAGKLVDSVESEMNDRISTLKKDYNKKMNKLAKNSHSLVEDAKELVTSN